MRRRAGVRCHNGAMLSDFFNSLVTWVGQHPVAAGLVIFLIAFCDAIIVLGIVVPALPLLFAIGATMVLSASAVESISAEQSAYGLFVRQLIFGALGLIAMFALSRVPARVMRRLAILAFWVSAVILALVVPFGVEVGGNRNWLSVGGFTLQPSEIAKLTCILALGVWLGRVAGRIRTLKDALWPSAVAVVVPVLSSRRPPRACRTS